MGQEAPYSAHAKHLEHLADGRIGLAKPLHDAEVHRWEYHEKDRDGRHPPGPDPDEQEDDDADEGHALEK